MEIRDLFHVLSEDFFGLSKKRLKMMLFQSKIVVAPNLTASSKDVCVFLSLAHINVQKRPVPALDNFPLLLGS